MIGIVVVSHSRALAEAAVELASALVPDGSGPEIAVAAGLDDGTLGTDAAAISIAIQRVDSDDGVLVLLDLGSAVMSTELAVEFLDPDLADNFVKLIRMLQKALGFTVVMVTHDLETLAGLATHVAVLADQRIIACGTPAAVLAVDHPFIRRFFCSEHALALMQKGLA